MKPANGRSRSGPNRNLILGVLALAFVFGGYFLAGTGALRAPFNGHTRTVDAVFANTADLQPASVVRVRGVDVGKVSSVRPTGDGRTTTVVMKLDDDAPRLAQNATAALRWRLVLGGNYQIELDPGDGPKQDGTEKIDLGHTTSQVEIDEVLSVLRNKQRTGTRATLSALPKVFANPDAPAQALQTLSDDGPDLGRVVRSVRGEHPADDLRRLISSAARTTRALDSTGGSVQAVIEGGAATLQTVANRSDDLNQTITDAAAVLPRIRTTLSALNTTLNIADPTVRDLLEPASQVEPTANDLRPTVTKADALLQRARPLLNRLVPASNALRDAATDALPLLNGIQPSLDRLNTQILPDLALTDATSKRPTYEMIGPTVAGFNAVAGQFDSVSHIVALDAVAGDPKIDSLGCSTYLTDLKPGQLANCEALLTSVSELLGATPPTKRNSK